MQQHAVGEKTAALREDVEAVAVGVPHMQAGGQAAFIRQRELRAEDLFLHFAGAEIVEIVQPDLPHRDHLGMRRERAEFAEGVPVPLVRVVRVHAEGAPHSLVRLREGETGKRRGSVIAHGDDVREPVGGHGRDDVLRLGCEPLVGEMAMGVDEHQQTSLPAGTRFSGATSTTSPSADTAQSSMPWLSMPRSLAGLRLATTTTCLPTISSGV